MSELPRPARAGGLDLLALPVLGPLLRWRHVRLAAQLVLLLAAAGLVLAGLTGPQLAPKNLATIVTWVHYRGLLVLALLAAGNLFCFGCPFLLPRELARKFVTRRLRWPAALSNKWPGIVLFVAVLYGYELFDLWASPWATAWLITAYFAAALAVDALFDKAPFCKSVCPVGQFNFVSSTVSPLEVRVREPAVCEACRTHDCIAGRHDEAGALQQRGCELGLFLPRKHGNLDCTFCLDCVHACPHDNVALATRVPAEELCSDPSRSGIGRLAQRPDLAVLVVVFVFGGLLNAFGMVSPVYAVQRSLSDALGTTSDAAVLSVLFGLGLVLEPALLLLLASWGTRAALGTRESLFAVARRHVWSLVPLGFAVWTAHYAFHFLTGLWTFVPVLQRTVQDATGRALLGQPQWGRGGLHDALVTPIEHGLLALGLLGSLLVAFRLAEREVGGRRPLAVAAPWMALAALLCAAALWLLAQPMEMRGTFLAS